MAAAIETHGLTKTYSGEVRAVAGLDLRVEPGEVFGYLGPSGAGKSTTIRMLLDLIRPTAGQALVLGLDTRRNGVEARRHLGYLPGDLRLNDRMTAREQLDSLARMRSSVDAGLRGRLCERFGVVLDRPIRQLSKGNRQKVGVVQAFMHRPQLVILDEPTSGLDPLLPAEFRSLVRETAGEGRTVFLSSHSLDEVQHVADRTGSSAGGGSWTSTRSSAFASARCDTWRLSSTRLRTRGRSSGSTASASMAPPAGRCACPRPCARWTRSSRRPPAIPSSTSFRSRPTSRSCSSSCTRRSRMAAELARRGLADHRRALAGWCLGIAGYCLLVASIFPSIKGSEAFTKLLEDYPDALKSLFGLSSAGDLSTGAGFIDADLFSLMLPLLVLVLGIGSGTRTFAGEEEAGRLELMLSYPVRRRNAVLAKAAAVAAEILILSAAGFVALLVLDPVFGLDLGFWRLAAAMGALAALGIFYGWLALGLGASVSSKLLAIAVPAGYAAAAYLVSGRHDLAGWLDPLRFLSPFWLIGSSPLQDGVDGWGVLVVLAAALAAVAVGAVLVERRHLEVA